MKRTWSLTMDDPLSLRIAADARLTVPEYADDQIWELNLDSGEPLALSIETTYGLRALAMRLFPSFVWRKGTRMDPPSFTSQPIVRKFYPNYLDLALAPFEGLEVGAEYWVPDSATLGGRFTVRNASREAGELRLRLHAVLRPIEGGEVMSEAILDGVKVLAGRTANLIPVVFLTGGAEIDQAAYPALVLSLQLEPGESRTVHWAQAGKRDLEDSFGAARDLAACDWDAEIARLEMVNSSMVDVRTGDEAWDVALALAQKVSLSGYVGPTARLPNASIVNTRLPDRGYSERGDGTDYGQSWDGQGVLQAYLNARQVLPSAPELAKGLLRNFLAVQTPEGEVDWKPGLGGQRNGSLCVPMLATMALEIYQHTEDKEFLEPIFTGLLEFNDMWFTKAHDRDQDGVPEWGHTLQSGFDDCPTFVRWKSWGQGLDITKAETPDLASYLYRESRSLVEIASLLGHQEAIAAMEARAAELSERVESSWSEEASIYRHLDRDLHQSPGPEVLGSGKGEFSLEVERNFDPPVRVLIRCKGAEGLSHAAKVFIHGRGRRGRSRVERLTERRFQWFWDFGTVTSEKTYAEIERVEIRGLSEAFETEVVLADYTRQDQLGLLPLWAGIPDRKRGTQLIQDTILDPDRFWRPFGIPAVSAQDEAYAPDNREGAGGVWMFWNHLLGEALVEYGYVDDAAELVHRLMDAVIHSLRNSGGFREAYHSERAEGLGELDHISGVAPFALFLSTLGVRLISDRKVQLRGRSPYPWPVEIRWRGLKIRWEAERAVVKFPDGADAEIQGDELQVVEHQPA